MLPEFILAIDLGGTQMRAALVTGEGSILARSARPTPTDDKGLDPLFEMAGEVAGRDISCAVVAVPGRVDYELGRLEHAPNLPERWTQMLRADYLAEQLGHPVVLANDADVATVGEAYFGGGRHHDDVAFMTISTGVGAGVVLGGALVHGRRSSSEIGHTIVDRRTLTSGRPATLEALGSGNALEALAAGVGLPADARAVAEIADEGDPVASQIWRELLETVTVGAITLAHLFSPEVIVLGGGVGRNADGLVAMVRHHLVNHGPRSLPEPIDVVTSELGDDAGLIGAAAWLTATQPAIRPRPRLNTPGGERCREIE